MKQATLYRMVTDKHICPYGIKSKDLLEREGFEVEDHHLTTRAETDAFKQEHGVETTPQTFMDGVRIGGYEALVKHFGKKTLKQEGETYQPIIALFATTLVMALAVVHLLGAGFPATLKLWIAFSMCALGMLKLQDLYSFSNRFLGYDLLAQRWVRYAYLYPFIEVGAGALMIAGIATWLAAPASLFIGTMGAVSVFKAVYLDKRDLKCACVGGNSSVPLGFISLTENVMMAAMGLWMLVG